jgi:hypothetical protein
MTGLEPILHKMQNNRAFPEKPGAIEAGHKHHSSFNVVFEFFTRMIRKGKERKGIQIVMHG